MRKLLREAPVGAAAPAQRICGADCQIEEERFFGVTSINASPFAAGARALLESALGGPVPDGVNRFTKIGAVEIVCVAPGEWLLLGGESDVDELGALAARALSGLTALVAPLSHGRASFRLAGAGARGVLASLTPLDFHQRAFPPGVAARSVFGECGAFVQSLDAAPTFRLIVDQSYADYALRMLQDACDNS